MKKQLSKSFFQDKKVQYLFLFLWVILNLFQAGTTELANDEAYYWLYAKHLELGYFDHPPMIALLIKIGVLLFDGEIGVRIIIVMFNLVTFIIIYHLIGKKRFYLLFAIMCSISVFHIYAFIAVPDAPLMTFSALFFLFYKNYLAKPSSSNIVLLSIAIALLLYSKYHGVLVLFFTLLSNISLLKKRSFYIIIGLSILLYFPHIYWQVINDYPSYKYHVLNKSQLPYQPLDTLIYLGGQLLIFGPIGGIILFKAAFLYKQQSSFERALKFNLYGILLFFLVSTLNAKVEPNWTVPIFVPLVMLSFLYLEGFPDQIRRIKQIAIVSFILFIPVRAALMYDFLPESIAVKSEFHGWDEWARNIEGKAKDTPVVFMNTYQRASKYAFYTGQEALSLNNIRYRRNQFDLWSVEDKLQGESVFLIPNWRVKEFDSLMTEKGTMSYTFIDNFRSYGKIAISSDIRNETCFKSNETATTKLTLQNNYDVPINFEANKQYPAELVCNMYHEEEYFGEQSLAKLKNVSFENSLEVNCAVDFPDREGVYYLLFSVKSGWLPPTINSDLIRVIVD